jgi:acetolactate synthase regulatory subunit
MRKIIMKKYSVLIKGNNLMISIDGVTRKHGFYTTRYVDAKNESDAKKISINLIQEELRSTVLNNSDDTPNYFFEDVLEIDKFGDHKVPGTGFTWFEE